MLLLGVIFLAMSALAQPTVYILRSPIGYPSHRVYLDVPDVTIIKESEPTAGSEEKEMPEEPLLDSIPEAPVLDPLPIVPIFKPEDPETKEQEIEEKKEEELEHKSEEEKKEEVLKEEIPKPVEIEEDKKIVIEIEDPKPPKFIASIISAIPIKLPSLPIKLPSFELPFDFGSWWKPKEKVIRFVPSYALA